MVSVAYMVVHSLFLLHCQHLKLRMLQTTSDLTSGMEDRVQVDSVIGRELQLRLILPSAELIAVQRLLAKQSKVPNSPKRGTVSR